MASADWMKMTKQKAGAMKRHLDKYAREFKNHSNKDIDQSKSHLNTYIGCNDYDEAYQAMLQRVAEVDEIQPPQKDMKDRRIISCMIEVPCPLAIQEQGRDQEFFEAMFEEMQKYFGAENVHGMFVHRDEQHEYTDKDGIKQISLFHGHTLLSAYTKEKGINGKAFETKKRLREFNKAIDDRCKEQFGMPYNSGGVSHKQKVEALKKEKSLHQKIAEKKAEISDNNVTLQNLNHAIENGKEELNQINNEAKEAYYLKESLQKEVEPLQSIIDRRNRLAKQYDKKIKSSKLHPDYWLVHDDIITEFLNVKSQAGQTLADQTALERRAKELEAKEEEIAHYQNAERSHAELNKQLYARIKSYDKELETEKEKAYEQAIADVSKALDKPITAIKSAIDLFSQVEQEADYSND